MFIKLSEGCGHVGRITGHFGFENPVWTGTFNKGNTLCYNYSLYNFYEERIQPGPAFNKGNTCKHALIIHFI